MNAFFVDSAVSTGLWIALKASALLGMAAIVHAALYRRASAATRHHIWTLTVLGVLLLPVMSFVLPDWAVVMPAAPAAAAVVPADGRVDGRVVVTSALVPTPTDQESPSSATRAPTFPWSVALVGVYAAGTLGMLFHLMVQQWKVGSSLAGRRSCGTLPGRTCSSSVPPAWASVERSACCAAAARPSRWRSAHAGRRSWCPPSPTNGRTTGDGR